MQLRGSSGNDERLIDVGGNYSCSREMPPVLIVFRIPVLYSIGEEISCLICAMRNMLSQLYGRPPG